MTDQLLIDAAYVSLGLPMAIALGMLLWIEFGGGKTVKEIF